MSATIEVSALAIQAGVPILWWGAPGTAKSSIMTLMGEALNRHVEVVISSVREPSDIGGLPAIINGSVQLIAPLWAKRVIERASAGIASIVFFDEISTAPPANQAALLRVILERVVGDTVMPVTTAMGAAANPPEQAAGGYEMSAPLANRFLHRDWTLSATDWVDGLLSGFEPPSVPRLKDGWDAGEPMTRAMIGGFIRHRPTLMLQVPESGADAGKAWPSPRTWTMAARMIAAARAAGYGDESDVTMAAVAGLVGPGPATEVLAWVKDLDLPDPEELLKHPERFKLPSRSDRQFAALASVAAAVMQNTTEDRYLAGWKIMAKAATDGPRDVAAAAAAGLLRLAKKRMDFKVPHAEIKAFGPLLKVAAGIDR